MTIMPPETTNAAAANDAAAPAGYDPAADGWKQVVRTGFIERAGPLWTRKIDGQWHYGILMEDHHLNPAKVVHGGVLMTLTDHAISTIAWEAVGRQPCLTIQLDSHFVGAVRPGQFVAATGRVVRKTNSLVFLQGSARVGDEEVFVCSAVMKIMGAR